MRLAKLMNHSLFESSVVLLIMVSMIFLALDGIAYIEYVLSVGDILMTTLFGIEMLIKCVALVWSPLWTSLWTPYGPPYGPPMDPLWTPYGPP